MKNFSLFLVFNFLVLGCTSQQVEKTPSTVIGQSPIPQASAEKTEEFIDVISLQKFLRMDYPKEKLGYFEKKFNSCEVGFGYSSTKNCRVLYSVAIHYQIKCRQSVGTISTILTDADLTPVESANVKWALKNVQGYSSTDSLGYGKIQTVSNQSQRHQRLRLAIAENFLYIRASDVNRIVTPQDWCQ